HQRIDEESQAEFGGQAAGGGVRCVDQTELLEVGHDVANRSRRQRRGDQARQVARADRLPGGQIALDDLPENLARALVELRQTDLRRPDRNVLGHRSSNSASELSIPPLPRKPVGGPSGRLSRQQRSWSPGWTLLAFAKAKKSPGSS